MTESKTVFVLGATGQIGIFAIPRLIAAGFKVIAAGRQGKPEWYPSFDEVEWYRLDELDPDDIAKADTLLSAGPVNIATTWVRRCTRVKRAVVFSTSSVFSKLESHDHHEKRHMQQILMDEAALSRECEALGISLSVFRPTLIYGCGVDGNVSWLARWIRRFRFMPIAGEASGLRQPVHADDLAAAAVATLTHSESLVLDVPLCGGSTISFRAMIERIFTALAIPERIFSVPGGLFTTITYVARVIPGLRGIRPEMVRRQAVDLVFDDSAPRRILGYEPRRFQPDSGDLALPEECRLKELAQNG